MLLHFILHRFNFEHLDSILVENLFPFTLFLLFIDELFPFHSVKYLVPFLACVHKVFMDFVLRFSQTLLAPTVFANDFYFALASHSAAPPPRILIRFVIFRINRNMK